MGKLPLRWDLDSLYEGGSESSAFARMLEQLQTDIRALADSLNASGEEVTASQLTDWTIQAQSIMARLREADSFAGCLMAENVTDRRAISLNDRIKNLVADFEGLMTRYDEALGKADDALWTGWLAEEPASPVAFYLNERRELAKEKLPPEQEALAGDLAVNGYHGWGELYNTIVSLARFEAADETGEKRVYSAGQLDNLLSHGDRAVRASAFDVWEKEWTRQEDLCADALNRLAGFRLKLYERRGWDSVLKEPLQMNRMSEATLQAMWQAVEEGKPALVEYLKRKAKLLGLEQLDWHDVEAPIAKSVRKVGYEEAASFIEEQFAGFSPDLAEFTKMAFEKGWIEAEDRSGKRPGGFCTSLPVSGETRIFMTYSGTASNVSTLAHELGHAYHQHVMKDLPPFAQEYAMNVAETASTFAEMIVSDSAVRAAQDPEEKLSLIEDKIQRSVAFFMNIHARFLFETRFYDRRRQGLVSAAELSELMEKAQREAFGGVLGEVHPHFWASKLHFYLTDVPFYNFPYTFGFLFSSGIYARAAAEGPAFAERYVNLLRDTASLTVEELAEKHLGVRLDDVAFWREAVAISVKDVEQFLEMTADQA
ncbi:M3 family oligoendopeptidase [Paenibacillus tarimensis]|uniref:M3 family oligoendopeptidase n=1 Tax=Paenibacillus tarimensis TaxID=416012 RepID=UPI001F319795|nr:M3 family oligoendopeptidase [Paenibacillus tarimensis]MCF2943533.1 M3 family oligoendopeptidase [Paenibacillus tarimensis]